MEAGALETETVLASGELTEVLGRLWDDIVKELEDDATGGIAVDRDVKLPNERTISIDLEQRTHREH